LRGKYGKGKEEIPVKVFKQILIAAALFAIFEVSAVTAVAQQITGTPGSPR
jgi:hypothetical protein